MPDHVRRYVYQLTSIKRLAFCVENLLDLGVARYSPASFVWGSRLYIPAFDLSVQGASKASKAKVLVIPLRLETKPYLLATTRLQLGSTAMPFARTMHQQCSS